VSAWTSNSGLKVVAIVQARMGSTRLVGKVLLDLCGKSVLARVVERLKRAKTIHEVLVATTNSPRDDVIVEESGRLSVSVFRGQEDDVLDRYYRAAKEARAAFVVRVTSDCPLIDPQVSDRTVLEFLAGQPDYASNVLERTYPRGLDTEVFTVSALERAWREADQAYQRAHVTAYLYEHPEKFRLMSVTGEKDYSHHRWTIDTPQDLQLVRAVYERLGSDGHFLWRDVLDLLDRDPKLVELNSFVMQKSLREG